MPNRMNLDTIGNYLSDVNETGRASVTRRANTRFPLGGAICDPGFFRRGGRLNKHHLVEKLRLERLPEERPTHADVDG
jgi:hypothetical protein